MRSSRSQVRTVPVAVFGVAVIALLGSTAAQATDYFITSYGSDDADGTAPVAHGRAGPFATLAPLTRLDWRDGDRIFLGCGEHFRGPWKISLGGSAPIALSIGRFGKCTPSSRPTIDGRVALQMPADAQVHTQDSAAVITQVFAGDKPLPQARFPQSGYLIFGAGSESSVDRIPGRTLLTGRETTGAVLHARTQEWLLEERNVLAPDGRLDAPLTYPLRPKAGAYITGKSWMIGDADGWAYDRASHVLAVRSRAAAPLTVVYEGPLLDIAGRGKVSIAGVSFYGAGGDAIRAKTGTGIVIDDVRIQKVAGNGISVSGTEQAQITNTRIEDTALDAIFFAEVGRVVVRRNTVINSGLYQGPRPSLAAINAHRTGSAQIEENIVAHSAYIGIRFAGDAAIRRNFVEDSCRFLSDGAALYTWRRNAADRRPPDEVLDNVVVGVAGDTSVKFGVNDYYSGIYLDEYTRDVTVRNNVILGVRQGIFFHNAIGNRAEGNVLGGVDKPMLVGVAADKYPGEDTNTNVIGANTVLPPGTRWVVTGGQRGLGGTEATAEVDVRIVEGAAQAGQDEKEHADCEPVQSGGADAPVGAERRVATVRHCR